MVKKLFQIICRHLSLAQQIEQDAWIDGPATSAHHQPVERCETHRCVDTTAVAHGAEAGAATEMRHQGRTGIVSALDKVNLSIEKGEFVTLVGPSGCGKSTLLNLISGLLEPSEGRLELDGVAICGIDRRIGYVTQSHNLFPWRTLLDNILFPLELAGVPRKERVQRAEHWLEIVGLRGFEQAYPHELSGGMRQRGNIVRTLIYEPQVILMDEPFGPLDAQNRITLQTLLLRIWKETRSTVIFITHDLMEAVALGDRVVLMGRRPGRVTHIEQVHVQRPRDIEHIHDDAEFRAIYDRIWNKLEKQTDE